MRYLSLLVLASTLAHAEAPSDYASGLTVAAAPGAAFYRLALPADVYAGVAQRDLADVRVFNADGALVPFAFLPRPASAQERKPAVPLPMFPLFVDRQRGDVAGLKLNVVRNGPTTSINVASADGDSGGDKVLAGFVIDATTFDEPLAALVFALPAVSPPTMHMRIDSSDDLAGWRTVVAHATLVNLEYGGRRLIRDRVEFAPTKAPYFRVSWTSGQPAMTFATISGEAGARTVEAPRQWKEAVGTAIAGTDGEFQFDLGGPFPVDRITMNLGEMNSVVPAELRARASTKDPWRPVATTVFYRLQQASGEIANAPVPVVANAERYWLLRIDRRAGGSLEAPRVTFGWQPREIVFAARGSAPFLVAFGSRSATAGALPIATLMPGYEAGKPLPANVGVAERGATVPLGGSARLAEPVDARRWLLWASLALAALVLGVMAWRLAREMRSGDSTASKPGPE